MKRILGILLAGVVFGLCLALPVLAAAPVAGPTNEDCKEVLQNIGYLLGLRDLPPRFDRFSYIEKAEYWALIWGSVVMAGTGFALWFENQALQYLPKWMLDVATMIHY